jgi:Putative zinc-finger
MSPCEHPDPETLGRFVLGRLDRRVMARIERHLRSCSRCGEVAMLAPDDRLVTLLRVSTAGLGIETFAENAECSP